MNQTLYTMDNENQVLHFYMRALFQNVKVIWYTLSEPYNGGDSQRPQRRKAIKGENGKSTSEDVPVAYGNQMKLLIDSEKTAIAS